jgi:hypothetical protein
MNKIMLQFYSPHGETEKYAGNGIKQQEHEYNRTIRMFQYFCSLKMNTDSYQYTKCSLYPRLGSIISTDGKKFQDIQQSKFSRDFHAGLHLLCKHLPSE